MNGALVGLNWPAVKIRMDAACADVSPDEAALMLRLAEFIEAGALAGTMGRARASGEGE